MSHLFETRPLEGQVAVVAGGTRGAGRGIAVQLGAAGAMVYVTGRSTRAGRSPLNRPETVEGTAEAIVAAGGRAVPVQVDHSDAEQVDRLRARILDEQNRLDVLVNDIWGGDPLTEWDVPFWELDLGKIHRMWQQAVGTHLVTSQRLVPLMIEQGHGLVVEVTDGVGDDYRGSLGYDLIKTVVNRLAFAQAEELRAHGVTALAVSPGFLRSEAMLDLFGVTEENWPEGAAKDPHFLASETPHFVGRAVAALAADRHVGKKAGRVLTSWDLAEEYGFTDVDGRRPNWGRHFADQVVGSAV